MSDEHSDTFKEIFNKSKSKVILMEMREMVMERCTQNKKEKAKRLLEEISNKTAAAGLTYDEIEKDVIGVRLDVRKSRRSHRN